MAKKGGRFPIELWKSAFINIVKGIWRVAQELAPKLGMKARDLYKLLWKEAYPHVKQYIYEKLAAGIVPSVDEVAALIREAALHRLAVPYAA